MAKYRLLSKAGYPERGFVEGKVYDEDHLPFGAGTKVCVGKLAEEYPEDWELVNEVPKKENMTKLIHLPTGEELYWSDKHAQLALKSDSNDYIRAELPEHWRVEGYDKSWEWFGNIFHLKFVGIDKNGDHWGANDFCEYYPEISRAEFEYHIYNPWKEGKYAGTFGNENRIEDEPTPYIETSFPRASQAGLIEDPADGKLKDPTKPTLAEIILQAKTLYGVDLVTKPAEETEIVFEIRHHKIVVNSDTLLIRDMTDHEAVSITREDFDMIAARSKEIPAKYEQERKG